VGAVFGLYSEDPAAYEGDLSEILIATSEPTDEYGITKFENLPLEQDMADDKLETNAEPTLKPTKYWVQEINTLVEGYEWNDKVEEFTLTVRRAREEVDFLNDPITTTVEFTKYTDIDSDILAAGTYSTLDGAVFTLTDLNTGATTFNREATSTGGVVRFEDIPHGSFKIEETVVPAYYK